MADLHKTLSHMLDLFTGEAHSTTASVNDPKPQA
jgi:hypothetical protein